MVCVATLNTIGLHIQRILLKAGVDRVQAWWPQSCGLSAEGCWSNRSNIDSSLSPTAGQERLEQERLEQELGTRNRLICMTSVLLLSCNELSSRRLRHITDTVPLVPQPIRLRF